MFFSKILVYVFLAAFPTISLWVGVRYNKKSRHDKQDDTKRNFRKEVKEKMSIYGVHNNGESMDNREIYLVPYSKIGY